MNAPEIVLAVIDALDQAGIPCVLVGSFSSNYYGISRSTQDADFLIQVQDLPVTKLTADLGPEFILNPQPSFEAITMATRYELRHRDSEFVVDLFLLRPDPHELSNFSRRVRVPFENRTIYMPTPEDVIITKLRWSKSGRRSKDISDVRAILAVQTPAHLDLAYIRHWTDQHGTREIFEKLLHEVT